MSNRRPDLAVNIWRRLSMVFYPNDLLNKFVAPKVLTAEEVLLKSAEDEIKVELINLCIRYAKKIFTAQQKEIFDHLMENKSKYMIAADMGWDNLNSGYYCIFVALNGRSYSSSVKKCRVGGLYKKLRLRLERNKRVIYLLNTLDGIKHNDIQCAIEYLKGTDKEFWDKYLKKEDME